MSKISLDTNIVSAEWLNNHLNAENLLVFNATIPKVVGNTSELSNIQIPNARFFDIKKEFSLIDAPFPNTIQSAEAFELSAQRLGVNQDSIIIVYDDLGIYSSARAWWLFKTFGFKNVAVLNGGFPEWLNKGYKTEEKKEAQSRFNKGNFKAIYNTNNVVFFDALEAISKDERFKIIDARSSDRFNCLVPEPRVGLRSGTISNSLNLPYNQILEDGLLKPEEELKTIFNNLASENQQLIFTCGSGITASILSLAATITGYKNSVYDGSWTEYGTLIQ